MDREAALLAAAHQEFDRIYPSSVMWTTDPKWEAFRHAWHARYVALFTDPQLSHVTAPERDVGQTIAKTLGRALVCFVFAVGAHALALLSFDAWRDDLVRLGLQIAAEPRQARTLLATPLMLGMAGAGIWTAAESGLTLMWPSQRAARRAMRHWAFAYWVRAAGTRAARAEIEP